jgi:hypothetical protein
MIRKLALAVSAAMLLASAGAQSQEVTTKMQRAADWSPAAAEGRCYLRVWVDDTARIRLYGDDISIETVHGDRAYDRGSSCTQPLPARRVSDFRVTSERGRGHVQEVNVPNRRNGFTGTIEVQDPDNGGSDYFITVAWATPDAPLISEGMPADGRHPVFNEIRACQDNVRSEFLRRNGGDAYIEFSGLPMREDVGVNRERVRGEAYARTREMSRQVSYECVVNERTNSVENLSYRFDAPTRGAMR